jgi:hypothetical protein
MGADAEAEEEDVTSTVRADAEAEEEEVAWTTVRGDAWRRLHEWSSQLQINPILSTSSTGTI